MRVQDLQQFLGSFTEGSEAVKNAILMVEVQGKLFDVRRMEVQENSTPIVGHKGHKELSGIGLKTLALWALLIYWGIIVLAHFSLLN
mgnify:CR=1 FL=1